MLYPLSPILSMLRLFVLPFACLSSATPAMSEYLAPLHFVEFTNNKSSFSALIDPGSQLNLVSHNLLPFLKFQPCSSPLRALRGVNGKPQRISQWICLPVTLPNGIHLDIRAAVVTDLPCVVLLGMPFLTKIQATHDIAQCLLHTPQGPIVLRPSSTAGQPPATYLTTQDAAATSPHTELDLSHSSLTPEQKQQVLDLVCEFDDLWRGGKRGKAVDVAHRIRLLNDRPVVCRPRQFSEAQQRVIKEEVEKMLADGVIRPSTSPYAQEVVLVLKKTGDWRFCIDYRALNKQTIKDKYPLPRISDLIHAVKQSRYFVALDLRAGYWQIPMEESSIKYTAFRCFLGLYEFLLMPFGLTNAPATFQRVMDFLFGDLRFSGVLCYLDDILIHAATFVSSLARLRQVFERLRGAGLTLSLNKCLFYPSRLQYLGQLIEGGQLFPDPKRVQALRRIPPPQTLSDVRSLLGFLGYYHAFIPHFAHVMRPVFDLLRDQTNSKRHNKSTPVTWTPEHQAAVTEAINRLEKSVLHLPLESDEFLVETDASGYAIGAVLSVRPKDVWAPVEFYSKTLSVTQQKWPAREREAYAIIAALGKFDHFLRGRHFSLHTDHESLKWMLECPKGKIARWASLMAEFDMSIFHKKGQELSHIDFLSRSLDADPEEFLADRMCYFTTVYPIPSLSSILLSQKVNPVPATHGFARKGDAIFFHGLLYVPPPLQRDIIAACHSLAPFHHPGIKKTKATILRTFNWPGLHKDVVDYLQSCLYCKRARSGHERLQGLFRSHPLPEAFDTIYMDFWECSYNGKSHSVLTLIDQATKWAECTTIPDQTAPTAISAFLRSWVYRFGVPRILMSDRDSAFLASVFAHLAAHLGITRLTAAPYHPEGNASIESFHRTLNTGLRSIDQARVPFDEALQLVLFGYRATIHSTTGHSPCFLAFGTDPRLAPDCDWRTESAPTMHERFKFLSTLRLDVQLQAQNALNRQNALKNQGRIPTTFEEGQLVLCRAITLEQLRYKAAYYKARPRWTLPHRVIKVVSPGKVAIVKCLLTSKTREIHIQDAQFIQPPCCGAQRQEWLELVRCEAQSMYDPDTCRDVIERFFEVVDQPQAVTPERPTKKKRERESESGGLVKGSCSS